MDEIEEALWAASDHIKLSARQIGAIIEALQAAHDFRWSYSDASYKAPELHPERMIHAAFLKLDNALNKLETATADAG